MKYYTWYNPAEDVWAISGFVSDPVDADWEKLFLGYGLDPETPRYLIKEDGIPQDRTFRMAWEKKGKNLDVNMPKARDIHMNSIRKVRNEKLVELDIPWMKAMEQGKVEEAAAISATKQKLRDIPQAFDLSIAQTPEELTALWPEELKN